MSRGSFFANTVCLFSEVLWRTSVDDEKLMNPISELDRRKIVDLCKLNYIHLFMNFVQWVLNRHSGKGKTYGFL